MHANFIHARTFVRHVDILFVLSVQLFQSVVLDVPACTRKTIKIARLSMKQNKCLCIFYLQRRARRALLGVQQSVFLQKCPGVVGPSIPFGSFRLRGLVWKSSAMFAQHSFDTLDTTVSRMLEADGQEPTSTATASNQREAVFDGRFFFAFLDYHAA